MKQVYILGRSIPLAIAVMGLIGFMTVIAGVLVQSNIIHISVTEPEPVYSVTLNEVSGVNYVNQGIVITGMLTATNGGNTLYETITIYDNTNQVTLGTTTTDGEGNFSYIWTPTVIGEYDILAQYTTP